MGKKSGRPKGGRPPGRRGNAGVGPGPGYRPNPNTGGKKAGGASGMATPPVVGIAFAIFIALPVSLVLAIGAYFAHGYGVI